MIVDDKFVFLSILSEIDEEYMNATEERLKKYK